MGWIIALVIIVLVGILPIGIHADYNAGGGKIQLIAGPVRILVFPKKTKKNKSSKTNAAAPEKKKEEGGSYKEFFPLVQLILDLLTDVRKKIRINNLHLKLILAGGDPCDLAVNYGRAWIALGNLLPLLEAAFIIKERNLEVECNFVSESTTIIANVDITLTIFRLLQLSIKHGFQIIKEYLKIMNNRKGGANV